MKRISHVLGLGWLASLLLIVGCSAVSPTSMPCRFGPKIYSDGSTVVLKDRGVMCICGDGSWTCLPAVGLGGNVGGGIPGVGSGSIPPGMVSPPNMPLDPNMGAGGGMGFGNSNGF